MTDHTYELTVAWTGNRGEGTAGYRAYGRTHTVRADGPPDLEGSADRVFRGDADRWNPEQLFVAALSQCHLLSYLHACADQGVVVVEYTDRPTGTMRMHPDGSGEFVEVVLHPDVMVQEAGQVDLAEQLHDRAHDLCFIARSVSCPVLHAPTVRPREPH